MLFFLFHSTPNAYRLSPDGRTGLYTGTSIGSKLSTGTAVYCADEETDFNFANQAIESLRVYWSILESP